MPILPRYFYYFNTILGTIQVMTQIQRRYTWGEFEKDVRAIAAWAENVNVTEVYGVPRGGLVPAVVLSHELRVPIVVNESDITESTLVVDDIIDTGESVATLVSNLNVRPKVAAIYAGQCRAFTPDFSIREKDDWVVFPWETPDTSRYDGTAA